VAANDADSLHGQFMSEPNSGSDFAARCWRPEPETATHLRAFGPRWRGL